MTRMGPLFSLGIAMHMLRRGALQVRRRYQLRGLPPAERKKVHHAFFVSSGVIDSWVRFDQ